MLLLPPGLSRLAGYPGPLPGGELPGSGGTALEAPQAAQGHGCGVLFSASRYGVNYGPGDLVKISACALRHG